MTNLNTSRSRRARKGFTLIELIVVILIILILVTVFIVAILPNLQKEEEENTRLLMNMINDAIVEYEQEHGTMPDSGTNAKALPDAYQGNVLLLKALKTDREAGGKKSLAAFSDANILGDKLVDAWGTPLVYREWKSKSATTSGGSGLFADDEVKEFDLSLALNKAGYDLFSAGADKKWNTPDDIVRGDKNRGDAPVSEQASE